MCRVVSQLEQVDVRYRNRMAKYQKLVLSICTFHHRRSRLHFGLVSSVFHWSLPNSIQGSFIWRKLDHFSLIRYNYYYNSTILILVIGKLTACHRDNSVWFSIHSLKSNPPLDPPSTPIKILVFLIMALIVTYEFNGCSNMTMLSHCTTEFSLFGITIHEYLCQVCGS